jgi:hypothetical protein
MWRRPPILRKYGRQKDTKEQKEWGKRADTAPRGPRWHRDVPEHKIFKP